MAEISDQKSSTTHRVAIALGSNLGDRERYLHDAVAALSSDLSSIRLSSLYDTAPVDMPGNPPRVLNAALIGTTRLDPHALLQRLLAVERDLGRERPFPGASRTVDLDLILYDDRVIDDPPELIVPHPRFRERAFVLEPLAEIAAEWVDPVTRQSVAKLRERLRDESVDRSLLPGREPDAP
jgi:2-amino-4-hydroxy-6-hydroxymethyldihydropteridine diphosphokinase